MAKRNESLKRNTMLYSRKDTPLQKFETNDCTVRTAVLLTRKPYKEVHRAFSRAGRRAQHGFSIAGTRNALTKLGARWRAARDEVRNITTDRAAYPTLKQFITAFPKGSYALTTNAHMFAVIDGVVHDWGRYSSGARCRITSATKILCLDAHDTNLTGGSE